MVSNALELATGLIDLWLVRPFGTSAMAAIGVSRQVTFLVEAMAVAITSGVITLVSQGVGARERSRMADRESRIEEDGIGRSSILDPPSSIVKPVEVVRQSLSLVLLMGLPTSLAGYWLGGPLLVCLQVRDQTWNYAEPYLQVYFAGLIFTWGSLVGAALFRGAGDVWTPLKLAIGVSLVQVVLDYLFIYGAGPVPAFEVCGAAMGAVCARAGGMLAYLFLLVRGTGPLRLRWPYPIPSPPAPLPADGERGEHPYLPSPRPRGEGPGVRGWRTYLPAWSVLGSLLRVGVPMALANVLRHGSRVVFLAITGASALSVSLQAAVGVALQVRLIGVLVALAFQTASATLVGQAIGQGDYQQAEMLGRRSVRLLALLMGSIAGILIVLAGPLAESFIDAPEVAGLGAKVLRWFAVAQFFSALSIATQGTLMGAGDTLPAMRYTLLSEWCLMLPLSYLLVVLDWVPHGVLAAWALAPALTLALMQRRFRSGRWKALRGKFERRSDEG